MSQFKENRGGRGGRGSVEGRGRGGREGGGFGRGEQGRGYQGQGRGQGDARGHQGSQGRGGASGGGGRGRNEHMGQMREIQSLLSQITDAQVLSVVAPSAADRNSRPSHGRNVPLLTSGSIGARLPDASVVTNHFLIDPRSIPATLFKYSVSIKRLYTNGKPAEEVGAKEDVRILLELLQTLKSRHPEWTTSTSQGAVIGLAYDGRMILNTTQPLFRADGSVTETIGVRNADGSESQGKRYLVTITEAENSPIYSPADWSTATADNLAILNNALFAAPRDQLTSDQQNYFIVGSRLFPTTASAKFALAPGFEGYKGYHASIRPCLAGLSLIIDMTVNCFLASGSMIDLLFAAANCSSVSELQRLCGNNRVVEAINKVIKGAKVILTHLKYNKKALKLGPPASSTQSSFLWEGHGKVTVAAYFKAMNKTEPRKYPVLRHPELPTVDCGSNTKPVLIPAELLMVVAGQNRNQAMTPQMTSEMIKEAAILPTERMKYITGVAGDGNATIVNVLTKSTTATSFGLNNTSLTPAATPAILLPPAKIAYANNRVVEPKLEGSWDPQKFIAPASATAAGVLYGLLLVGRGAPKPDWENMVNNFRQQLCAEATKLGLNLTTNAALTALFTSLDNETSLLAMINKIQAAGARLIVVILVSDCHGLIKKVADKENVATQCVKWWTVEKVPRGVMSNLLIKINVKLGGINHTLASRAPNAPPTAQKPPASLSWLFDTRCMLVGIDVSHPEPGSKNPSMAAVVGSMDGSAVQYVAQISSQTTRQEMVAKLDDAMKSLLTAFKAKNGDQMPKHIVVYRDGVSEGQFNTVLDQELPAIHRGIIYLGYPADSVKVSVVVCTKGHHTRLFYKRGEGEFVNPCPGLCVDATGGSQSITSATHNEFYLNSHVAIQGTCKPCKYTLIYDDIGFKLGELELLTYWTTYLYSRCNRSVSYATPAYYAHWASKRAKDLAAAGATSEDLNDISNLWASNNARFMPFI